MLLYLNVLIFGNHFLQNFLNLMNYCDGTENDISYKKIIKKMIFTPELRDHVSVQGLVRAVSAPAGTSESSVWCWSGHIVKVRLPGDFRENMLLRHVRVYLVEEKCFITLLEKFCNFCVRVLSQIGGGVNEKLDRQKSRAR